MAGSVMGLFRRHRFTVAELEQACAYFTYRSPNRRAARKYRRLLARAIKAGET
jgi:hypothetical protein